MIALDDTICAPASGNGGAIAVIRVSGPHALQAVDSVVSFRRGDASSSKGYSLKFGSVEGLDDVLVSVFRSPASYTGEDAAEISCHASSYIVSSLLDRLVSAGCRLAGPGEFTQRAFVNGKMDLAQAEAVADVIASSSAAEHRVAMGQMKGAYSAELRALRNSLLELAALLELELDFSEEEVEFANRESLRSLCRAAAARCRELSDSFRSGNALKNGIPVAIAGAPNSGKSTLLNALLGDDRAIVSDVPGTTRDTVEEIFVIDGMKFRLIDTAGLRETSDVVEKMGVQRSLDAVSKADIVLHVVDCTSALPESGALEVADNQTIIRVENKIDITGEKADDRASDAMGATVRISALTGAGLPALRRRLSEAASRLRVDTNTSILVTNARHAAALRTAAESLQAVLSGLDSGLPGDLVAEDLRASIASVNSILGEDLITPQDTLNEIFGRFCIGK